MTGPLDSFIVFRRKFVPNAIMPCVQAKDCVQNTFHVESEIRWGSVVLSGEFVCLNTRVDQCFAEIWAWVFSILRGFGAVMI